MKIIILALIMLISLANNTYAGNEKQKIKVDFVYDGDTFFADGERVRVWGIQSPEFKTRRYFRAGAILEDMIVGKYIDCLYIDMDRYNRKVMQCWIDGVDISEKMIKSGEADEYTRFTKGYYKKKGIEKPEK